MNTPAWVSRWAWSNLFPICNTGDLSSISGSESDSAPTDDEDDTPNASSSHVPQGRPHNSPYVHFSHASAQSHTYSIYRCIVGRTGVEQSHDQVLHSLREPQVWLILMRSGGHFAGAVFRG